MSVELMIAKIKAKKPVEIPSPKSNCAAQVRGYIGEYAVCAHKGCQPWLATRKELIRHLEAWNRRTTEEGDLCSDCPPVGYSTEKTRCTPCPRRTTEGDAS